MIEAYFKFLKHAIVALLAGMVIVVFTNVFLRKLCDEGIKQLSCGITMVDELSRWMLVYMVFLGAIIGIRDYSHLGVDTLVRAVSPLWRRFMYVASHTMMIICCVLLVMGAWKLVQINWKVATTSLYFNNWVFYASGIVFGISAIVVLSEQLYRAITGQAGDDELVAVKDSEEH